MILKASNQMTAPISAAVAGLQKLEVKALSASRNMNALGKSMQTAGKELMRSATMPLAMIGGGILGVTKFASSFEDSMARISTITGRTTKEAMEIYGKQAIAEAARTGQKIEDIAAAQYDALSRNVPEADLNAFIAASLKTAKAGTTTVAVTTKTLAMLRNVWKEIDPEQMGGLLAQAQKFGGTDIGEIAQNFGRVAQQAKNAGVSAEEALSIVASLTQTGKIEESVTGMSGIFRAVMKPTQMYTTQLKELGINLDSGTMKQMGFRKSMEMVLAATKRRYKTEAEQSAAIGKLFADAEAFNAILNVTSANGMEVYNNSMKSMKENTNFLDMTIKNMGKTTSEETAKMREKFKGLAIEIGIPLLGSLNAVMGGFVDFIKKISDAARASKMLRNALIGVISLIGIIAGLAWGAGAAIWFAGLATRAWAAFLWLAHKALIAMRFIMMALTPLVSFLFSPVGILLVGIPLIIYGLTKMVKHWDTVKDAIKSAGSAVYEWFLAPIGRAFVTVGNWLAGVAKWFYNIGKQIAVELGNGITDGVTGALEWVQDKLGFGGGKVNLLEGIIPQLGANTVVSNAPQAFSVDMSGMTINATDGADFAKKAWGTLKPNLETQMKTAKQNQARTKMED